MSESVMPDEPRLPVDDEIAELTDALLRGESVPAASNAAAPLLDIALRLEALIAPHESPSAGFERQLRAATEEAWAARAARPRTHSQRVWTWVAAAAALLLLAFLMVPAEASFPVVLAGAAVDRPAQSVEIPWRAVILLIGLAGTGVYWWYRRRSA